MLLALVALLLTINCHLSQATYVVGWGSNSYGQLGNGTTTDAKVPVVVGAYGRFTVTNIRIGLSQHFAMFDDGSVYCSGNNFYGQLGLNHYLTQLQPVNSSLAKDLDVYAIGPNTIGYSSSTQTAYGWGLGAAYVGITATTTTVPSPTKSPYVGILGVSTAWTASFLIQNAGVYSAGAVTTFAGYNADSTAKLGTGATTDQATISRLSFYTASGDAVSVLKLFPSDASHVCGLSTLNSLYCWGKNNLGQLGLNTTTDMPVPTLVSFFDDNALYVAQVRTGDAHTIALTCGGKVYAWGTNLHGNLGLGTSDNASHPYPTLVTTLSDITDIRSAINSVFARNSTNDWFVWGAATANITLLPLTGDQLYPVNNPYFKNNGLTRIATNSKSTFAFAWNDYPNTPSSPSTDCPELRNECALGISNCADNTLCVDTERSYTCVCGSGFYGNGINTNTTGGTGCNDINECLSQVCVGIATCVNQLGGFACSCPTGYAGDGLASGIGCQDINECTEGGYCPPNTDCANSIGSFSCSCSVGYRGIGTTPCGPVCVDIDECQTNVDNCIGNTICVNTPGSYNCSCLPGYSGSGCTDINECVTGKHNCALQSYCNNTQGSFTCNCPSGYTGDGVSLPTGGVGCLDINECATSVCSQYAVCNNKVGSYQCICNKNFTGNGTVCTDINECLNSTLNKCVSSSNNGMCTNTVGGYYCGCSSGYLGDGVTTGSGCKDINECNTTGANDCDNLATCTNLPGTYNCSCPTGYLGSGKLCYTVNCSTGNYPINATSCAPCPAGSYNNRTNVEACTPCPAGTYNANTGSKVPTACTSCPLAQYSNAGSSSCTTCALGSVASTYGTATCSLCPAGQYGFQGSCKSCGVGYYSSSPGSGDCLPCPAGYYTPNATSTACSPCPPGTMSTGKASSCTPCTAGRYQPRSGQYYCLSCPPGYSTLNNTGASSCTPCAAGSSTSVAASATCSTCGKGTYAPTGSDVCLSCQPGSFQDQTGQGSCKLCSNWQFSDSIGATTCSACYQGYAGEYEYGSVNCLACPPGTYRTTGTLSVCLPCYAGSSNQKAGEPHCTLCMGGYYAKRCGQITCDACPPSTYSSYNSTGQTSCPFCAFGSKSYGTAYFCYV